MDLVKAKNLCEELLAKHQKNLYGNEQLRLFGYKIHIKGDWKIKLQDETKSEHIELRLGAKGLCDHLNRTIVLHRGFVKRNSKRVVKAVMLHEIAHAYMDREEGHSEKWEAKAKEIGSEFYKATLEDILKVKKIKIVN